MTTPAATPHKTKNLGVWIKSHHGEVYIGLAGLVLTAIVLFKSKSSSTTALTTATGSTGTASSVVYLPSTSGAADVGSPSDVWSGAGTPGATSTAATSTGAKTTGTVGRVLGSTGTLGYHTGGYSILTATGKLEGGSVVGSTGSDFTTFDSWAATTSAEASGTSVDVQTAPGIFQTETASELNTLEDGGKKTLTTYFKAS